MLEANQATNQQVSQSIHQAASQSTNKCMTNWMSLCAHYPFNSFKNNQASLSFFFLSFCLCLSLSLRLLKAKQSHWCDSLCHPDNLTIYNWRCIQCMHTRSVLGKWDISGWEGNLRKMKGKVSLSPYVFFFFFSVFPPFHWYPWSLWSATCADCVRQRRWIWTNDSLYTNWSI